MMNTEYLIIGNSAGGIAAAEAIRQVDKKGGIIMVSDEPYPAYSRPLIAKILTGERTLEEILFRPEGFYEENGITCLQGEEADALDFDKRTTNLKSGEVITWKKLLLATGGKPIVPLVKGSDKKGIFNFITLDDARAIDAYLPEVKRAVVIGGGLIGTSVTDALLKRGIEVSVVEMKDKMLNIMLDDTASTMAEDAMRTAGVSIITGHTVAEIKGKEKVSGVILDDGKELDCQMIVVAIGVLPRVELVSGNKLKTNRGIVVDRFMATSIPCVYACGDVAEAYDFVYGSGSLTPIWPNAYIGGRTAGLNMAGVKTEYRGGTAMNALNYFELDIVSAGAVNPPEAERYEVLISKANGNYKKVIIKDGLVTGMVMVGDIELSGIIFGLMRDRIDVGGFKQSLLDDDFGLAYLPSEKLKERLALQTAPGIHKVAFPEPEDEDIADE